MTTMTGARKRRSSQGRRREVNWDRDVSSLDQYRGGTVNSLVSGHPRELKKVSVSGTVRLRELFP